MSKRTNISENQLSLPFRQGGVRAMSFDGRVRFFWALITISTLSFVVYVYAINSTARNIALRQDLEKNIAEISVNLNSLEFAYIELKNNVTIELAYHYGFKEVQNPLYVSRRPISLSLNTLAR